MISELIAVSHPGKMGDALYTLPTIRYLCERHNAKADFFTSSHCQALTRLFEKQSCINRVIVPEEYKITHMNCGIQPWEMPIRKEGYAAIYQLGFRQDPKSFLADHIADSVGAPVGMPIFYEFDAEATLNEPYIVVAPGRFPPFRRPILEALRRCPIKCAVIGSKDEYPGEGLDLTALDPLATLPWLAKAQAFLGTPSSPLVLANAFPIPKVVLHDGQNFDLRCLQKGPLNFYAQNPSANDLLILLGQLGFSKTLHPQDYLWIGEAQHVKLMLQRLQGVPYRLEHQHRLWEYGLCLKALKEVCAKKILDVGGGASIFAPTAAWQGIAVTQVDPAPCAAWAQAQAQVLKQPLRYIQSDLLNFDSQERFDAVTCLSVIEHVADDQAFFDKLLSFVKTNGLLFLTTDFHPAGQALVPEHLRTYNRESLEQLIQRALKSGFDFFGPRPNYHWSGPQVNSYNFAALCLRKVA